MIRILRFLSIFLLVAIVLLGGIFLANRSAFTTLFENREGMAEGSEWVEDTYSLKGLVQYIRQNPDPVSISSIVLGRPDSTLALNEGVARPMGTLSNLFVMIAYSDGFAQGTIDPQEAISWEKVGTYQLPGVSEAEHQILRELHEAARQAESEGTSANSAAREMTLQEALQWLAISNDLALSDYLLVRLGRQRLADVMNRIGLPETEMPAPFSGLYLSVGPARAGSASDSRTQVDSVIASMVEQREWIQQKAWQLAEVYGSDQPVAATWKATLEVDRLGISFMQERDALGLFPRTTAREMTRVLERLATGRLIGGQADGLVVEWLSWASEQSTIRRDFEKYAGLYDDRMGLLNGIDIATSRYTGDTTVQAVFFDRLPVGFWFHLSANHMVQDFEQRLIYDPALIQEVRAATEYISRRNDGVVQTSAAQITSPSL